MNFLQGTRTKMRLEKLKSKGCREITIETYEHRRKLANS